MTTRKLGMVSALWRYPVKSMRGERMERAVLTDQGTLGDRTWALRELKYGGIVSARIWPEMLQMSAHYESEPKLGQDDAAVRIDLPGGRSVSTKDPGASDILSEILRWKVRLERTRPSTFGLAELEAVKRGEAYLPQRDFFDEDVIHVIASGTLEHLRSLNRGADFDPRRFRPNICVDTGDDNRGFVEDGWLDGRLEIGQEVRIVAIRPAIRCAMTTHPQAKLPHDATILRTAWQHHEAYVGVFASVGTAGTIALGDPVTLST
jgi:MOSC domain-containing protein